MSFISFNKTKKTKYGNHVPLEPCKYGNSHRSKLELSVCHLIWLRERAGELKLLQHEDHIRLSGWYLYIPDFKCLDLATGEEFWIEAKGGQGNDRWPSTKKGWRHAGPGRLEVWKGTHVRPVLDEVITPRTSAQKGE